MGVFPAKGEHANDYEHSSRRIWSTKLKAFRTFLLAANKSTGLAHPSDRERWFRFLIIAYKESIDLDSETLIRWLMEEERWPEDKAFELALNYEIGHELLNAYDHNRSR